MKLPKLKQLTQEQKNVYLYAPTDKHVLVHGPPGTGKTLIAYLRAAELRKRAVPVVLGMFNRVLARYTSNLSEDVSSQTMITWFRDWWYGSGLPPHPDCGWIVLRVPFEQKEQAKSCGARWDPGRWRPWEKRKGAWIVDAAKYLADGDSFADWEAWHGPPLIDGDSNKIAWRAAADHILMHEDQIDDAALSVGALLIDEGQDFAPDFYKALANIAAVAAARGDRVPHPPRCFVLADQNQQLTSENSTLEEIATTLKIPPQQQYVLLDNFRNSKEIAQLARAFSTDVSALPRIPTSSGAKPLYSTLEKRGGVVERIQRWIRNNPGDSEVGVLVFDEEKRAAVTESLKGELGTGLGREVTVQTYSWKSREQNRVDGLIFDEKDVVTVLNMQSCKGLEFDAVFIVDLHQAQIGLYGPDKFKMHMFVAVSRGRKWVQLIDSGPHAGTGGYLECLPGPDVLERDGQIKGSPASRPTPSRGAQESAGPVPAGEWARRVTEMAKKRGLKIEDLRPKGGAFWVVGGSDLEPELKALGFAYVPKRGAWWRK